jgi:hypothetical protein
MKKNTKLIKKALKALEGGKVRLCANKLKDGSSYCAVGFLTAFAAKNEPKKVAKALKNLGALTEYPNDKDGHTDWENPISRPFELSDLFNLDDTSDASEVCGNAYGLDFSTIDRMIGLNDSQSVKASRVERLRLGLRAALNDKKAQKKLNEISE